jgi:general stress protein 26
MERNNDLNLLADKIRDIRIAMLTTVDEDGSLCARPMATNEMEQDGTLWFFTQADSPKTHEIDHKSEVNISYADTGKELFVSVSGKAEIVKDKNKIKQLWTPLLKAWFPKGEEDPSIILLKVKINKAQYWDAPANRFVQLIGMAKAAITEKPYKPGETKKINI